MSLFEKHFLKILEADQVDVNAQDTADAEKQAMQQQLEPTTDAKAFDAQVPPDIQAAIGANTAAQKKSLT